MGRASVSAVDYGVKEVVANNCQISFRNGFFRLSWTTESPIGADGQTETRVVAKIAMPPEYFEALQLDVLATLPRPKHLHG